LANDSTSRAIISDQDINAAIIRQDRNVAEKPRITYETDKINKRKIKKIIKNLPSSKNKLLTPEEIANDPYVNPTWINGWGEKIGSKENPITMYPQQILHITAEEIDAYDKNQNKIGHWLAGYGLPLYQEAKQNVEYQEPTSISPTVSPAGGPTGKRVYAGTPVYGPGNSIIGYTDTKRNFTRVDPSLDRGIVDKRDEALLGNDDELRKYVKSKAFNYAKGGMINDDRGQWAHPGKNTRVHSPNITMEGVPYQVMAFPNVGMPKMMEPGQDYYFPGADYVDEFPMMQKAYGGQANKFYYNEGYVLPRFEDGGPGSCGPNMYWDTVTKTCVPRPANYIATTPTDYLVRGTLAIDSNLVAKAGEIGLIDVQSKQNTGQTQISYNATPRLGTTDKHYKGKKPIVKREYKFEPASKNKRYTKEEYRKKLIEEGNHPQAVDEFIQTSSINTTPGITNETSNIIEPVVISTFPEKESKEYDENGNLISSITGDTYVPEYQEAKQKVEYKPKFSISYTLPNGKRVTTGYDTYDQWKAVTDRFKGSRAFQGSTENGNKTEGSTSLGMINAGENAAFDMEASGNGNNGLNTNDYILNFTEADAPENIDDDRLTSPDIFFDSKPTPKIKFPEIEFPKKPYGGPIMINGGPTKSHVNTVNRNYSSNKTGNKYQDFTTIIDEYPGRGNDTSYIYNQQTPRGVEQFFYSTNFGNPMTSLRKDGQFLTPEQILLSTKPRWGHDR